MGTFNLLDEAWITVMTDHKGNTKDVSVKNLFLHAHEYKQLAGDMAAQNFALLRFLLAILHTVFSRFDASGEKYRFVDLDERYLQMNDVSDQDLEDYREELFNTWIELWAQGQFPMILDEYLSKWHDHFYLFDDRFPIHQVTKEDLAPEKISKGAPSFVAGKNMNRLISESANKISLFSPKYIGENNKDMLNAAELARWLLTYQGYTGLSDKVILGKTKYKASKGWLFDIGGVTANGSNLFETLLLNCMLVHSDEEYFRYRQRPCWEYPSSELIQRLFSSAGPDSLAELYTNWSRAIYIDPQLDFKNNVGIQIVKLPEIEHKETFLEPMTLWRFNSSGDNKNTHTPRKHRSNRSFWRSFGSLTLPNSSIEKAEQRQPGIIEWLREVKNEIGEINLTIHAISMEDDGNATSWVPVDEISDSLNINNFVLTDALESGWIPRIHEAVELTKRAADRIYRQFITEIKEIRNLSSNDFVDLKVEDLYFRIDQPFRNWLADLKPDDGKDEKIECWIEILRGIVLDEAEAVISQAGARDFKGIIKEGKTKNIATAYNSFKFLLNKQIPQRR